MKVITKHSVVFLRKITTVIENVFNPLRNVHNLKKLCSFKRRMPIQTTKNFVIICKIWFTSVQSFSIKCNVSVLFELFHYSYL